MLHLADEVGSFGHRAVLGALTGDERLAEAWRRPARGRAPRVRGRAGGARSTWPRSADPVHLAPRLDADLLVTAALVHDLGYTRAWRVEIHVRGHRGGAASGASRTRAEIVGDACRRTGLAEPQRLSLLHCIAWHHGPPGGAALAQASPEALALYRGNAMEVQVKARLEGAGIDAAPSA